MKFKKIVQNLLNPIEKILRCMGKVLNQSPEIEELKKLTHSPLFNNPFFWKTRKVPPKKIKRPTKSYERAKGSHHSDTKIYNHPRR